MQETDKIIDLGSPYKRRNGDIISIGDRFGYLTIMSLFKKNGVLFSRCKCDCGTYKDIVLSSILSGKTLSCGCYSKKRVHEVHSKGNFSSTRLYNVWVNIKQRCLNKNNPSYKNYGGRGITICEEWRDDFISFKEWADSSGYDFNHERGCFTIDRIDNNGNYEPSNCRWITIEEQQKNKRGVRLFNYKNKNYTIKELAQKANVPVGTMRTRIYTIKMTVKEAVEYGKTKY